MVNSALLGIAKVESDIFPLLLVTLSFQDIKTADMALELTYQVQLCATHMSFQAVHGKE
jgi:hypothetical protein